MRFRARDFVVALGVLVLVSGQARADWLLTPFAGANFGGNTGDKKLDFGASLGFMGAGVLGAEVDLGYSRDFFDQSNQKVVSSSHVLTLMGNIIVGIPVGGQHGPGVRPYVVGGLGLIRPEVKDSADLFTLKHNDFGGDIGAGVIIFFADRVGVRGDYRYFRSFKRSEGPNGFDIDFSGFNFSRATGGIVFRF
jgi:opacity protein-like surface antigen